MAATTQGYRLRKWLLTTSAVAVGFIIAIVAILAAIGASQGGLMKRLVAIITTLVAA